MKKIALILVIVLLIGTFAGCNSNKETANGEKMAIRWMGFPIDGTGKPDSEIEKYIEEKFDVELEPIFITYGDYADKKSMMLAGDDIPDVIYEFDPKHVRKDADQGFIAEISYDTIKEYAPDLYKTITECEPRVWSYSRVDDKNFGIPNLSYTGNDIAIGLWREDWLKNVGIDKVPETIEEMGEALYRFKHNDPDGNGKNDTYGMTSGLGWNVMFNKEFGAYGALPFNWIKTDDGKYVYGGLQENTVEALRTITDWYSKGLIHPDFVTDGLSGTAKDKFANGQIGYLHGLGGYYDKSDATTVQNLTKSLNPKAVVVDAHPPVGPEGKSGGFVWGSAAHIVAFGRHLENDKVKMQKILEILNAMVSDEVVMLRTRIGEDGVSYKLKDGATSISEGIEFLPPYDDATYRKELGYVNNFASPSFFMPVTPTYDSYLKYTSKERFKAYDNAVGESKGTTDAFLKPDLLPSSGEYFETIRNSQIKLMVDIITGVKSVNSYMSEFTNTWDNYGGKELEKEAIETGEAVKEMLKEIGVK